MTSSLLSRATKALHKGIYSERKESAPSALTGADSFLQELIPIEEGGKNENGRVASPESVLIHLYFQFIT